MIELLENNQFHLFQTVAHLSVCACVCVSGSVQLSPIERQEKTERDKERNSVAMEVAHCWLLLSALQSSWYLHCLVECVA